MKWLILVVHILILSVFYLVGVWIQQTFNLFIPGSIIGMFLLFLALLTRILPVRFIEQGSAFILRHMPLLFIPVTVGILQFLDVFAGKGIMLILITLLSTMMVLITAGLLGQSLVNRKGDR